MIPDERLPHGNEPDPSTHPETIDSLTHASAEACIAALQAIGERCLASADPNLATLLRRVCWRLVETSQPPREVPLDLIARIYGQFPPDSPHRGPLLQTLAALPSPQTCAVLAELLAVDPPAHAQVIGPALAVYFQRKDYDPGWLFPRLLDSLEHPAAATGVLDLANFLVRNGRLGQHPASDRTGSLCTLLGVLTQRLLQLESDLQAGTEPTEDSAQRVSEGVALAIAVCNSLDLIRDRKSVDVLLQASQLRHRRLRLAAATSLARLGHEQGERLLIELAAEPLVRIAACHAATEFGVADKIPPCYRTPVAIAEASLVGYLAHPIRFGFPPHSCELRDHRVLHWPGYEDPIDCYQFEFAYDLPQGEFRNLAVAGPAEITFSVDLTLWTRADVYALAAGWLTEHPDIEEWEPAKAPAAARTALTAIVDRWQRENPTCGSCQTWRITRFWERWFWVGTYRPHGGDSAPDTLILDTAGQMASFPSGCSIRPLGPDLAYACHKGRLLLQTFNPLSALQS